MKKISKSNNPNTYNWVSFIYFVAYLPKLLSFDNQKTELFEFLEAQEYMNPLNLTFIPSNYWNEPLANFSIIGKSKAPPKLSGFFLFWINENSEEVELVKAILRYFPTIPALKLATCRLNLVQPIKIKNKSGAIQKVGPIIGKIVPLPPLIKLLFNLVIVESNDRSLKITRYSDSVKAWAYLTKMTIELLVRGNFVPILEQSKTSSSAPNDNSFQGKWQVVLKTYDDHQRFNSIVQHSPWASYCLPINFVKRGKDGYATTGVWHPSYYFSKFMDVLADKLIRTSFPKDFYTQYANTYGFSAVEEVQNACTGDESSWDLRFLNALIGSNTKFEIRRFCDTPIPNILENWVRNTQGFAFSLGVSFTFRLEYPKTPEADWNLGYYLQPLHNSDMFFSLRELWSGAITQKEEFANYCDDENVLQLEILRALGTASKYFPPIRRSLDAKNPYRVKLKSSEVMGFLQHSRYFLVAAGFNVALPPQFESKGEQRLTARMVINSKDMNAKSVLPGSGAAQEVFTADALLNYKWEAQLEGKTLTEEEFRELADSREPLIYWRDQWVLVDQQDMETLKPLFEQSGSKTSEMQLAGEISYSEAIKMGMMGSVQLNEFGSEFEVVVEGNFQHVMEQITNIEAFVDIPTPPTFNGTLRPYQQTALTWLTNMSQLSFGVCLADDMGLGKTIEIISFLQHLKQNSPKIGRSTLIVCPTSVLFNWGREIKKFAPNMEYFINHGPNRYKDISALEEFTKPHRIILTTYGTVRNDVGFLQTIPFAGLILDESQNIKNYKTRQTQAILKLQSEYRVALSGTPIENRLTELWTLFQFLNPGLLGKGGEFQKNIVVPIERFHNETVANKLKRIISPFIMRRLKSDKNIIKDLPEKNEIKVFLELTDIQGRLYQDTVQKTIDDLENLELEQKKRQGLILKLLTKTKQICNHPFQFMHVTQESLDKMVEGEGNDIQEGSEIEEKSLNELEALQIEKIIAQSVKMERLVEMIDEVLEEGEKILIFTQFRQMGDILHNILERKYGFNVAWFHGGVPEKKRRVLVDDFQSSELDSTPIMLLSLRAGGTGLNLTQASTVIHFDRWWNPAVEDQATDRAYRIGQTKQVNVYKFIAIGTIEEKIDQILEEKKNLADTILSSTGETWITGLSNADLKELFSLGTNYGVGVEN